MLAELFTPEQITILTQIIFIDLVLAGDNAIIIGMVASKFPPDQRKKVIFWGIGGAVILRIILTLLTAFLLQITGLRLIGGLLLLYIVYKLYIDVIKGASNEDGIKVIGNGAVELFYDNTKRFETTSNGFRTNGELIYLGPNNTTNFIHSGGNLSFTADTSVFFVADCNDTSGDAPSGEFIWGGGSNTNTDTNQDFTTAEFGNQGKPRDQYMILDEVSLRPANDNDLDLGTTSLRWKNIYTMDLQLSNEAKKDKGGNDVDGTWGDWTLQEGEEEVSGSAAHQPGQPHLVLEVGRPRHFGN